MNGDNVTFMLNMIEQVSEICKPGFVTFSEDMTYNHGPMLSKQLFDEFIKPYYRKIMPLLKEKGILTFVDSDGQIEQIAPWFQEIGIDGMLPLERQAGVDVVALRRLYPEMRFIGGFDKTVMTHGEGAMRKEFERLLPVMRQGGIIPS
jgi:uroporphyrinogen-III decarboxylase